VNNITIKIDNKEIQVKQGTTILEAAKQLGIEIPTLCHNDKITHTTSCFVCIVKDKNSGKFLPSCSAQVVDGMEIESSSDEVYEMRKTALNLLLSEHSGDCEAPCTIACPAHANVEEYVREGKNGNFLESLKIIKEKIPLPISIGRVCPRFCEKDCRRNTIDSAVAINDFKRIAADLYYEKYMEEKKPLNNKKVAIIGAGPAGYSSAYYLRLQGVSSVIFDKMPKAGGMLRYGIPEYRLPKSLLDKELNHFEKMGGIEFKPNYELGKNLFLKDLKKEFDAIIVAIGSWKPSSSRIEGEELAFEGIRWLEKIASNNWQGENPKKTIVIGGGNTAMDCLRTAVRLGKGKNEVICLYRRTENEMPAEKIEIKEAKEEGVIFQFLTQPIALKEKNGKKLLICKKMKLGQEDASGRRRPIPIEGSEFELEADTIIGAIGQKTDATSEILTNKWGDIQVNEQNMQMQDNIFSAGDCVTGPATVVEAVASGRRAALGVLAFFENKIYEEPYQINVSRGHWKHLTTKDLVFLKEPVLTTRTIQKLIPLDERKTTFNEVSKTFTQKEIQKEGERCLECSCSQKHNCMLKQHSETYKADAEAIVGLKKQFSYQAKDIDIIFDPHKCIRCGTCVKIGKEIVNNGIFGFKNRGFDTIVGTIFDSKITQPIEELKIYVENCPTGALSFKK
jgi:formate dehydrogenase major subunit